MNGWKFGAIEFLPILFFMQKPKEVWKQITIHELRGVYMVGQLGRIKKLGFYLKSTGEWRPSFILTPQKTKKGYYRVNLSRDGYQRGFYVHRLVAMFFVDNPDNKPCVNHKDGDKANNHYTNLEWCTDAENNQHAKEMGLFYGSNSKIPKDQRRFIQANFFKVGRKALAEMFGLTEEYVLSVAKVKVRGTNQIKKPPKKYKSVIDTSTNIIYKSAEEVAELTGMKLKTVRRGLSGERFNRTPFRYIVKGVVQDDVKLPPPPKPPKPKFVRPPKKVYIPHPLPIKKVVMFDKDGNKLQEFDSSRMAAAHVGTFIDTFRKWLRSTTTGYHKGFIFKYA